MQFTSETPKGAVLVGLAEGSQSRFTGTELVVGVGSAKTLTQRKMVILMRKVVSLAKQNKIKAIEIDWAAIRKIADKKINDADLGALVAVAFLMANYEHTTYKTAPKDGFNTVGSVHIANISTAGAKGVTRGEIIGIEVNACRELCNTPGGDMTPEALAEAAIKAAEGTKAKVKILGRAEMAELGMGAVLGIAKGSDLEPQFIVVEYWGAERSKKPVVLVGKGVTFDTGGLNLKPGDHMYEMHMDMSGGAAVIHAVAAAAKLGVKKNVVALVPAVENSPGGKSVRPGDILKSMSGKTIEILNTDAEGRVILADALTYAKRYKPAAVVDVATLTGAAFTALGVVASAFMTNKDTLVPQVMEMADSSGDYMWPFPLWDEYDPMVKGHFGDVPNISTMGSSRNGGVIAGGKFLEVFAKELDCPWIHIDMATRMTSYPGEFLAAGAAGAPVRFLLEFIEKNRAK